MALSFLTATQESRTSQLLPSVKCSTCGNPVPFTQLTDHICKPTLPGPVPRSHLKPQNRSAPSPDPRRPADQFRISPSAVPHTSTPPTRDDHGPSGLHVTFNVPPSPHRPRQTSPENSHRPTPPPAARQPIIPPRNNTTPTPAGGNLPAHFFSNPGQDPPAFLSESDIDTKSGGEAGMAGVGRRGFAAAARAAMLAIPNSRDHRENTLAFLNTHLPPRSTDPNSLFPQSPVGHKNPAPYNAIKPLAIPSNSAINSSGASSAMRNHRPAVSPPMPETPTTAKLPGDRVSDASEYSASVYSVSPHRRGTHIRSESGSSIGDLPYAGLAYAETEDEEESDTGHAAPRGKPSPPHLSLNQVPQTSSQTFRRSGWSGVRLQTASLQRKPSISSMSSASSSGGSVHAAAIAQALGLQQRSPSEYGRLGGPGTGKGMAKSGGSSGSVGETSGHSRRRSRSNPRGGLGKMELELETLLENVMQERERELSGRKSTGKLRPSKGGHGSNEMNGVAVTHRCKTVQGMHPATEPKLLKLPARAQTSITKEKEGKKEGKEKVCLKCETKIENGRWIRVDSGEVLCERCWKNMYLPKCRRCNLPIEKQVVSSSDGQLKGKYHRECFNCNVCHKPFPDKSFYVFEGKPLCAYHYHEANNSLCAAARCGQPIEGPCAVSHTGDRYHPEHMMCEWPRGCAARLAEYWEVEGRMLCAKHAWGGTEEDWDADERAWMMETSRAQRRVTRFINLND